MGRLHLVKKHIVSKVSYHGHAHSDTNTPRNYTFLLFNNEMPLKMSCVKRKTPQFMVFKIFSLSMRPILCSIPTVNNKNTWMEKKIH